MENVSPRLLTPWVDSVYPSLSASIDADVVVVWAWIAGCMTAYFLLHNTTRNVVLLDAWRIARGASWHNAWQIDVFFETPVKELIQKYGIDMAKKWYQAMFDAWVKLDEIVERTNRQWQYAKYIWYNVYTTKEQLFEVCEQLRLFDELGLEINELFVCEWWIGKDEIPPQYIQYVNWITKDEGEKYIWSKNMDWLCYEATHYATVNSAALCHALVKYMISEYTERFVVYEETWITSVTSGHDNIVLSIWTQCAITALDAVFCTNAYHSYSVDGEVDVLHVDSIKWYMAWYYVPEAKVPTTIWYQPPSNSYTDWYYYHSVRHYYDAEHAEHTLVSLGWPDVENGTDEYPLNYKNDLDQYIKKFYNRDVSWLFYWSGDMWYTDTWLRKIWLRKNHHHIRYNIWCNGVGILWSIHGWRKISQYFLGEVSEKSIFDI